MSLVILENEQFSGSRKASKYWVPHLQSGWGNEDTQQLIDILGKYNIKATFFVVGDWVEKYPESVKALHDAGHEIMNHSDDHPHMSELTAQQIIENVSACDDKIEAITGIRPFLFRPPYGDYNDTVINTLRSMGHYPIQWDVDSMATVGKPCGVRVCALKTIKMDAVIC